jgi:hypothetical protein
MRFRAAAASTLKSVCTTSKHFFFFNAFIMGNLRREDSKFSEFFFSLFYP